MCVLAIDIGGTKTLFGIIDSTGNIIKKMKINTDIEQGKHDLLKRIKVYIRKFQLEYNFKAIGIASAGRIDVENSEVYFATDNLPNWTGIKFTEELSEVSHVPIVVDNDVNCAGIGEKWIGRGNDLQSFICITLGTGIASAIYINDELIHGRDWSAGEIGHMIIYPNGTKCNCGQKGCLEEYCSGRALVNRYNQYSVDTSKINSGEQFFELIQLGNKIAFKVLEKFTFDLSIALINIQNTINPQKIIIGGGLLETKRFWWDDLKENINLNGNNAINKPLIVPARLGNDAGIVGAARLALNRV